MQRRRHFEAGLIAVGRESGQGQRNPMDTHRRGRDEHSPRTLLPHPGDRRAQRRRRADHRGRTALPGDVDRVGRRSPQAIRGGADLGAIIVSRDDAPATIDARDERGLRMPIFMISGRDDETLAEPFLKSLDGVAHRRPGNPRLLREAAGRLDRALCGKPAHAVLRRADAVRLRRQPDLGLPGAPGRADVHAPSGRPAVLRAHGRERLPRRHLQRDGVARRPADPRRAGAGGAAGRRQGLPGRPHLLRPQRHLVVQQGGQHRAAAQQGRGPVRPQQPQVEPSRRAAHGRRHPDLPGDRPQRLRHGRARSTGRRSTRQAIREKIKHHPRLQGHRCLEAGAADPRRDHRAVHLRRHGLQRQEGAGEDRSPVPVHPLRRGLGRVWRVPSADEGSLQHGPGADATRIRASSPRSRRTSSWPASRRPRRSTCATPTSATSRSA